ncbi:hypothetical protein NL676_023579 [Syzygium grande]|nr:hypothetical protein NL676_023579 [Syzygium grande]
MRPPQRGNVFAVSLLAATVCGKWRERGVQLWVVGACLSFLALLVLVSLENHRHGSVLALFFATEDDTKFWLRFAAVEVCGILVVGVAVDLGWGRGDGGRGRGRGDGDRGGTMRGRGGGCGGGCGGRGRGGGCGGRGRSGGRGGMKGGSRVVVEPHRHEGVFIAKGKEDALVTKNMVPGEAVCNEKRISV